jgi:2-polyprenyl-3-methyl-5-hydroxy-6-metoxy-1,4-benzoquinol methylase
MECAICGNAFKNVTFWVKEMMFGTREKFKYFKCSICGCLQIAVIPKEISKYYPNNYYSYSKQEKPDLTLRRRMRNILLPYSFKYRLGLTSSLTGLVANFKYHDIYTWLNKDIGKFVNKHVLDVGSGSGSLLTYFDKCGFKSLIGIDTFLREEITKGNVSMSRNEIFDLQKTFDLIMFHHSFEHMQNPHKIFKKLYSILSEEGKIIIRTPLIDSYAWRKYGVNWFQIDAPRHLFLHTVNSLTILAESNGFTIEKILYDSTWQQFFFSEIYQRNIGMLENRMNLSKKERTIYDLQAKSLNQLSDGDQACFYIRKNHIRS